MVGRPTVNYCVYQAIDLRRLQCHGLQTIAGEEEEVQRRHGGGRRTFQEDLTRANITWEEAEHTVMDRPVWRQAAAQCTYWHERNHV